jgi:hypothetical protein
MPSKDKLKKLKGLEKNETRPFIIFYMNVKTPKEVLTDTIMAQDYKEAQAVAATKHMTSSIVHVRGIGDNYPPCNDRAPSAVKRLGYAQFPCARFINGKFLQATFTDDPILETLSDPV